MSTTATTWVDFRELRARLRFIDLLQHYRVELKIRGDRATGFCPLPKHPQHDGKRHSPSFSADLARGIFQCFGGGCGAKGGILDFACYMEGVDPANSASLRRVALMLQDQFLLGNTERRNDRHEDRHRGSPTAPIKEAAPEKREAQQEPSEVSARPVIVNAPLDFTLKVLDVEHPYLKQRGLTAKTISDFGLGYCSRGLMQGRIAIPLHDAAGKLVGYAGRLVDDDKISDENPKYRFPGERDREGVHHEFRKSLLLYNAHQITPPVHDLVIVEGFASVWWLVQNGHRHVVAIMGSSCSPKQAAMIARLLDADGRVWAFTDGDDAGRACAASLFTELGAQRFVRWIKLDQGRQPTDCGEGELSRILPVGTEGGDPRCQRACLSV
jgi:DNA primase